MKKKFILVPVLLFTISVAFFTILIIEYSHKSDLYLVLVDKQKLTLSMIRKDGSLIKEIPVAVGTGYGNKEKKGDMKTPEGIFQVQEIVDAHDWKYDFTDDSLGLIKGAYGPWFIRLNVPGQKGIGLHGTSDNTTIGKRISHGCVRMNNDDIEFLKSKIQIGALVVIIPGLKDYQSNFEYENINQ
jgi:lipoprotein-anchoring transpeptidase ErfK/SrfK